jgi:hypothetical protein
MEFGLIVGKPVLRMNELERNVLLVALDHMKEHLENISDEVDVTDRLEAVSNLQKSLK